MSFVNLTPHQINIHSDNGITSVAPDGTVARVSITTSPAGFHDSVPLVRSVTGDIVGLPDAERPSYRIYIVSMAVRLAAPHRKDIASPGELIRDDAGNPIGCKGLVVN